MIKKAVNKVLPGLTLLSLRSDLIEHVKVMGCEADVELVPVRAAVDERDHVFTGRVVVKHALVKQRSVQCLA
jgi:hypothetical protein